MRWLTSRLSAFAWGQAMAFIGLFTPKIHQKLLREAIRRELRKGGLVLVRIAPPLTVHVPEEESHGSTLLH